MLAREPLTAQLRAADDALSSDLGISTPLKRPLMHPHAVTAAVQDLACLAGHQSLRLPVAVQSSMPFSGVPTPLAMQEVHPDCWKGLCLFRTPPFHPFALLLLADAAGCVRRALL